jgi:hypothetical protein
VVAPPPAKIVAEPVARRETPLGEAAPVPPILTPRLAVLPVQPALGAPLDPAFAAARFAHLPALLLDRALDATLVATKPALGAAFPAARSTARLVLAAAGTFGSAIAAAFALGVGGMAAAAALAAAAAFHRDCRHRSGQGRYAGEKHQLTHVKLHLSLISERLVGDSRSCDFRTFHPGAASIRHPEIKAE